ncbi:MAG: hypothetical protein LBR40_02320, partial [Bacilli bacterium]|nr:hypothetical protein [Bacilli bacterium]
MKKIILSEKVENSKEKYDAVISNIEIVNELHDHFFIDDDIHYDSLCSYFVDVMDEVVSFEGFKAFLFKTRNKAHIKDYVVSGLKKMNLNQYLTIFEKYLSMITIYEGKDIYELEGNVDTSFHQLDEEYRQLGSKELEYTNADFLLNHPDTIFLDKKQRLNY